jgi:protein TonB
MAFDQQDSDPLLWALVVSLALHGTVAGFLPGFSLLVPDQEKPPITVELMPPPPPPPPPPPKPEPEKPNPEPVKPKIQQPEPVKPLPKPLPPPPQAPTEPPPPAPPPVMAIEQPAAPPPPSPEPVFTVPEAPQVPPPPVIQARNDDDINAARSAYGSALAREFAKHRKYPQVARMRGWQGTVKVSLQIDAEGNGSNPAISESSGKQMLDDQALETVKKAMPLPLPPEILRGKAFSIIVPVVFRLENG